MPTGVDVQNCENMNMCIYAAGRQDRQTESTQIDTQFEGQVGWDRPTEQEKNRQRDRNDRTCIQRDR